MLYLSWREIKPPDVRNGLIEYLNKRQRRKTWSGTRPLFNFQGLCTAIPKLDGDQILTGDWGWHDGPLWHELRVRVRWHEEQRAVTCDTICVQSQDHPIVTFSLSVVIHFSAKSPENNVNLMIPPFTAAWFLRFLFGKFVDVLWFVKNMLTITKFFNL